MRSRVTRRMVLRGTGALLALPWFESAGLWADEPELAKANARRSRFVALYMGNGVHAKDWWGKGSGAQLQLSKTLQPLEPHKDMLNVLQGLYNPAARGEQHIGKAPVILSSGTANREMLTAARSVDQVIAARSDREFSSLVLGVEGANLGKHAGWPLLFSGHISWSDARTPVPRENSPRALYRRLVGDPQAAKAARQAVDSVQADTKALLPLLSHVDRQRFDQYLTQLREIEQRLERPVRNDGPGVSTLMPDEPPAEPIDTDARTRLMIDLIAVALASGKTDVATLMFQNDLSQMDCSFAGSSPQLRDHHGLSHRGGTQYQMVNQYYVQRYADLLAALRSYQDGDASLLDHCCVLFCSSLMQGGKHDSSRLPILVAGKIDGSLPTGRSLSYQNDQERRLSNCYLSILQRFGVEAERFADSTGTLKRF